MDLENKSPKQIEIYALFLQELEIQAMKASSAALEFEKSLGKNKSALKSLQISIHSIKGATRIVKETNIEALCHQIEELLIFREQEKKLNDKQLFDLLIRSIDQLVIFSQKGPSVSRYLEIQELLEKMKACMKNQSFELAPKMIEQFSDDLAITSSHLSIERKHARYLFGMAYEIRQEAQELQQLEGDALHLKLKKHIASCQTLCDMTQTLQMIPFSLIANRLERYVREAVLKNQKEVRLIILNKHELIDKVVLDKIKLPLLQLIQNAIDHGIESTELRREVKKNPIGIIVIEIQNIENNLVLTVTDDGAGIDFSKLEQIAQQKKINYTQPSDLLFCDGLSSQVTPSLTSGRGVGLMQVQRAVSDIGGTIEIDTSLHVGTTFLLNLPITLSYLTVLLVEIGGELYGFENRKIDRVDEMTRECCAKDGITIVDTRALLGYASDSRSNNIQVCIVELQGKFYGLDVDTFIGTEDVMVQDDWSLLEKTKYVMGCALSKTATPLLLLRVEELVGT